MKYGELTLGQTEALMNKIGGMNGLQKVLSGEWVIGEKNETTIDTIIHIDRAAAVPYPDWVKDVLHPTIERNAPAEYDLADIKLWLHDGQQEGKSVLGHTIYEHLLQQKGVLDNYLSLSDGLAIQQQMNVAIFRKVFRDNYVFLWGSVVRDRDGVLFVPYVCVRNGQVLVYWCWFDHNFHGGNPAARFAS